MLGYMILFGGMFIMFLCIKLLNLFIDVVIMWISILWGLGFGVVISWYLIIFGFLGVWILIVFISGVGIGGIFLIMIGMFVWLVGYWLVVCVDGFGCFGLLRFKIGFMMVFSFGCNIFVSFMFVKFWFFDL